MTYEIDICGLKRDLPICKLNKDLAIGAFVIFGDVELTEHCAKELLKRAPEFDYLIAPEAKSIPLVYEMSRQSGKKYFLARKNAKAYMSGVFEVKVQSITTFGVQTLCIDTADAEAMKGKRIVILDALRGFALMGIALANYPEFSLWTFLSGDEQMTMASGSVDQTVHWWMYLLEVTKDENNEVTIDKLSDNGEDWIGFRSIRREETNDAYIYYFDFGDEYEARRINVDAIEDDSLGYIFWSGYEYTPPEDQTTSLQDIYESDGKEFTGLVAGYSEQPVNFPDVDNTDTFGNDDVRFGSLHIASITPSLDTVTKRPVEMNVMENLPEISCFDFIKDIFYMNGALPRVDKDGKTIVAMYYNQLRDRMLSGECVDWSDKLISGKDQASLSKYENTNFGQRNYFEMGYSRREKTEEDKRDELELYGEGYGTVGIADSLLADEKSVYKSKFFPGLRQDIAYPLVMTGRTIKAWDGEKHVVTTTNPLYGYLNIRTLDEEYEDTENWMKRPLLRKNGKDFKHIRMNAFEPFEDIDDLFGYLGAILENYTCVKEKMLLNEFDLRDFDESVPVYLHKYNAFFAVSSIQRDKTGLSTVELILLPYVEPTYKDSEETEEQAESFSYEILNAFLSFKLNLTRTYTSNVCPLMYDIFVNNRNEGWSTTYNTLQEGLEEHGYYLSKWVSPYNDKWDEQPYTLEFTINEKVS